jgi:hypothetical protein
VTSATAKVTTDKPMALDSTASSGLPVTYAVVSGPATIVDNRVVFTGTGTVVVKAVQAGNDSYTPADATVTLTALPVDRLVNVSTRMRLSGASSPGIVGFVVTGDSSKQMLIRAIGPGLKAYGVSDPVSDPQIKLYDSAGKLITENSGWNNDAAVRTASAAIGAFALEDGSKDAAFLANLAPGAYTVVLSAGGSGTVLAEVYDAASNAAVPTKQLVNISARGGVDGDRSTLVAGFVVSGAQSKRVLIRGIGSALAGFGVDGALADPVVTLYNAKSEVIAQNDNWSAQADGAKAADVAAAASIAGAFAVPDGSKDAALIVTLPPGAYTAGVSGAAGASGVALVEVYELPE